MTISLLAVSNAVSLHNLLGFYSNLRSLSANYDSISVLGTNRVKIDLVGGSECEGGLVHMETSVDLTQMTVTMKNFNV